MRKSNESKRAERRIKRILQMKNALLRKIDKSSKSTTEINKLYNKIPPQMRKDIPYNPATPKPRI